MPKSYDRAVDACAQQVAKSSITASCRNNSRMNNPPIRPPQPQAENCREAHFQKCAAGGKAARLEGKTRPAFTCFLPGPLGVPGFFLSEKPFKYYSVAGFKN
jgi:hypothetical protein